MPMKAIDAFRDSGFFGMGIPTPFVSFDAHGLLECRRLKHQSAREVSVSPTTCLPPFSGGMGRRES